MALVAFDTLKLVQSLRDRAQLKPQQADTIAAALAEAASGGELATKADVTAAIAVVQAGLATEIAGLRAELALRSEEAKADLGPRIDALHAHLLRLAEQIDRRASETEAKAQRLKGSLVRWTFTTGLFTVLCLGGLAAAAWTLLKQLPH